MSLVGWWPLNGNDTKRIGEFNTYEQGSVQYGSGKFGQCYDNTADNGTGIELIRHDPFVEYEAYYSFSLWFKSTTTSGSGGERVISRDASEYPTVIIDQNEASPQTLDFYEATGTNSTSVSANEWHHLAFSIDVGQNESKLYIDGDLVATGGYNDSTQQKPYVIGGNTEGDGEISGRHFVGKIDDVRLYDHVLSKKEVKKLSRGKVLHYSMNAEIESTTNELPESLREMSSSSGWQNSYHSRSYSHSFVSGIDGREDVYEITHDGTESDDWYAHTDDGYLPYSEVGETWIFSREFKRTSGTVVPNDPILYQDGWKSGGTADREFLYNKPMGRGDGWRRIAHRFTMNSAGNPVIRMSVGYTSEAWSGYFDNIQMEKTYNPTTFVNGSRSQGITDSTGRGNIGIENGTRVLGESEIGTKAKSFDGDNDYIDISDNIFPSGEEITITFWSYGGSSLPTQNSVVEVETASNNRIANIHLPWDNEVIYWDTGGDGGSDRISKSANSSDYQGRWSHWAFTKNANTGSMKIYLDGQEWHSGTGNTTTLGSIDHGAIGSYSAGTEKYWDGRITDFRVYAKSLSDSDVENLYKQRASIDAGGVTHTKSTSENVSNGLYLEAFSRGNDS